jgi:hypothetical protein
VRLVALRRLAETAHNKEKVMRVTTEKVGSKTLIRLVRFLEKTETTYAILGSIAVQLHGGDAMTTCLSVLLTKSGFDTFCANAERIGFDSIPERPRRFVEQKNRLSLEVFLTGHHPGRKGAGPIAFPDPSVVSESIGGIHVPRLPELIALKLAAQTYYDSAEVVSLIRVQHLEKSFRAKIHSAVRKQFLECLQEIWRDEEWEAQHIGKPSNRNGSEPGQ